MARKSYLVLADLYLAYRKAKYDAFFEKSQTNTLKFSAYEVNLEKNLQSLHERLTESEPDWFVDLDLIGSYTYLPKDVDETAWNKEQHQHFSAVDPSRDWLRRFQEAGQKPAPASFRLVISATVNMQVISALWILKVGHIYDEKLLRGVSFGNRLKRHYSKESGRYGNLNIDTHGLFNPYFTAYQQWRERGLQAIDEALVQKRDILAITMDIERFYHRVSPLFLLRKSFLKTLGVRLTSDQKEFTSYIIAAMMAWYKATPDYADRPQGALPVGLSASKVIANVLLAQFDKSVIVNLKPVYYGRYVDDVFLVFDRDEHVTDAETALRYLAGNLPGLSYERRPADDIPSLRLRFTFARDSQLTFAGHKQKIFSLESEHGRDLVEHIREQIRQRSSEYRLLPDLPIDGREMSARALLTTPDATLAADALRKADVLSIRRLGLANLLADVEQYAEDLKSNDWSNVRMEFYGIVHRHMLTPKGFFEYGQYLQRVFGLMVACGDFDMAGQFVNATKSIEECLKRTTTASRKGDLKKLHRCMDHFAQQLVESAMQASTLKGVDWGRVNALLRHIDLNWKNRSMPRGATAVRHISQQILLADFGRRPYKSYWIFDQARDENKVSIPSSLSVRKVLRLRGIRRFRRVVKSLRIPHWPALAFATRPVSPSEISLIAPRVVEDPVLFADAIMVCRGAKVSDDSISIGPTGDEVGPLIYSIPGKEWQSIRVAITSFETTDHQWQLAARGKPDRSAQRYSRINKLINQMLLERPRPDYMVFPELSVPYKWAHGIAKKLTQSGVSFIAGIEYYKDFQTKEQRNDVLLSLCTRWPYYSSNVAFIQPKFAPAHKERIELRRRNGHGPAGRLFTPKGSAARTRVYSHRGFCFGVLICSDLTNIVHRHALRGAIDALFILEWNPDTATFASLVEATAIDLHAYVAQVNNRLFGDSRLRVPAKIDHMRDVVRVKGGENDYFVIGRIEFIKLRKEQRRKTQTIYKPLPIGYQMSQERRKS
jgi:predicted amidohydrolase